MSSARPRTLTVRRRAASALASVAVLALATAGLLLAAPAAASAADAQSSTSTTSTATPSASPTPTASPSTSTATTQPAYVIALWRGAAGQQWPSGGQKLVTSKQTASSSLGQLDAAATQCGMTFQVDLYANDQTTTKLISGGVLYAPGNPAESWPGGSYRSTYSKVFTNPPCGPLGVQVSAGACTAPTNAGGTSAITAVVSNTVTGHNYIATLSPSGATKSFSGQTAPVSLDFGPRPAGSSYTVTVVDQNNTYVSARSSVAPVSCPQVGGISIEITPCTSAGGTATLTITSSDGFVAGRSYQVHETSATGPTVGPAFTATSATSYTVPVTPNGDEYRDFYVVDVATGTLVDASAESVQVLPCPTSPTVISVTPAPCSAPATTSDVTVSLGGLTPGRTYIPSLDGTPRASQSVTPTGTTATVVFHDVLPGAHTVGVVDRDAPSASATAPVEVPECATRPQLLVTPTQCAAPVGAGGGAGSGSLGVDLNSLVPNRDYTVTITSGGSPVTGVDAIHVTPTSSTEHVDFPTLRAGSSYVVTVTDDAAALSTSSPAVTLTPCPQVGALTVECTVTGSTATLTLAATDLVPGDQYSVTFERANSSGVYSVVKQAGPTASLTPADLSVAGVIQGQAYRVTLLDVSNSALSPEVLNVTIQDGCTSGQVDSVTYTAGGQVDALAITGTDTGRLVTIALLLLVPGVGLIGFAFLRHRREVRE